MIPREGCIQDKGNVASFAPLIISYILKITPKNVELVKIVLPSQSEHYFGKLGLHIQASGGSEKQKHFTSGMFFCINTEKTGGNICKCFIFSPSDS